MRRTADNYGRTAVMLTGFLTYAERVRPGWLDDRLPSASLILRGGVVGEGEQWCETFADAAHGNRSLRGTDRKDWTAWRDVALMLTTDFRAAFDPQDTVIAWCAGAGMSVEALGRTLRHDAACDPLGLAGEP